MKMSVSPQQVDNLRLDAKTLVDISRLLEMDGRFKVMPSILDSVAADILEIMCDEDRGKEVVV